MNKQDILTVVKKVRESSPKRKFVQTVDVIFNLRNLDLKKETDKVNTFVTLPFPIGKKLRVTALVGQELATKAKGVCDTVVVNDEFKSLGIKRIKKLSQETDYFIAQANIMPQIAATFGKILGPRGKMPNMKAGCIVQPTADLKPLFERLQKTIRVETKNEPTLKTRVGLESAKDEELVENINSLYTTVLGLLPQDKNNLKDVLVKTTMGKPVVLWSSKVTAA